MDALRHPLITSNGSQYLHPEYIQPLPTTVDAKKSPLALLAQTCSSIGKEVKPKTQSSASSTSSSSSSSSTTSSPIKLPTNIIKKEEAVAAAADKPKKEVGNKKHDRKSISPVKQPEPSPTKREKSTSRPSSHKSTTSSPAPLKESIKSAPTEEKLLPTATQTVPGGPLPPPLFSGYPFLPQSLAALQASAFMSAHKAPSLSYTRVKTPMGGSTLIPICRDPYCANCQVMMQHAQLGCPPGCTQCSSEKLQAFYNHNLPNFGQQLLQTSPYVCNWMSGADYCGKRFISSEELFQHLRSHTGPAAAAPAPTCQPTPDLASLYAAFPPSSFPPQSAFNPLIRNYPTSLSPNTALRYHPYGISPVNSKLSISSTSPSSTPSLTSLTAAAAASYSPFAALYPRLAVP